MMGAPNTRALSDSCVYVVGFSHYYSQGWCFVFLNVLSCADITTCCSNSPCVLLPSDQSTLLVESIHHTLTRSLLLGNCGQNVKPRSQHRLSRVQGVQAARSPNAVEATHWYRPTGLSPGGLLPLSFFFS